MNRVLTMLGAVLALLMAAAPAPAFAAAGEALDEFARDVVRTKSVRDVKTLTRSYAQYAQFGLWNEIGALFTPDGTFTFDGLVMPSQEAKGPAAIAAFLRARYGGGEEELSADGLSSMFIENPLVNLSPDGKRAKARWNLLVFHGHDGEARIPTCDLGDAIHVLVVPYAELLLDQRRDLLA